MEEQILLDRIKKGDFSALASLVQEHGPDLFVWAYFFTGDPVMANELVKDTFFKLWKMVQSSADIHANIHDLLVEIVEQQGIEQLKRTDNAPKRKPQKQQKPIDPQAVIWINQILQTQLTPAEREVVQAVIIERNSFKKAAKKLKISLEELESRLVAAFTKIYDHMRPHLETLSQENLWRFIGL